MELMEGIQSRTSALKLEAPGPTREHIETMLRAAVRAPDHGRLRPWRFVVLDGEARNILGNAMAELLRAKAPDATDTQLASEAGKVLRAPTIIVIATRVAKAKTPEIEQISAVAAAAQNMFLAAHALGYGMMWKTGGAAYDRGVKQKLGLAAEDHIVGFMYVGKIATPGPLVTAPLEGIVSWL